MFADHVRAALSTDSKKTPSPLYYWTDRLMLSRLLDDSLKMIVSEDVWKAANEVCKSKPSSIQSATPLVRLPYEQFWLEWKEPDFDITWGALITGLNGFGHGYFRLFYQTDENVVSTGFLTCFDFERDVNLVPWRNVGWLYDIYGEDLAYWERVAGPYRVDTMSDDQRSQAAKQQWEAAGYLPSWLNSKKEVDAFWELQKNILAIQDFAFEDWWNNLRDDSTDDRFAELLFSMGSMTGRQGALVRTVLTILNSKNIGTTEFVPTQKMPNNLRKKLPTQTKLYSHHLLKLDLTKVQQNRASAHGLTDEQMRAHLVRGHFKVRKSGIFWWSPFVRGSAKRGIVSKDYDFSKSGGT